jgi:DNA-binding response OmpR family regulator
MSKKNNGSILVLDDDFDINNLLKISLKKKRVQCLWLHRPPFSVGTF